MLANLSRQALALPLQNLRKLVSSRGSPLGVLWAIGLAIVGGTSLATFAAHAYPAAYFAMPFALAAAVVWRMTMEGLAGDSVREVGTHEPGIVASEFLTTVPLFWLFESSDTFLVFTLLTLVVCSEVLGFVGRAMNGVRPDNGPFDFMEKALLLGLLYVLHAAEAVVTIPTVYALILNALAAATLVRRWQQIVTGFR